MGLRDTIAAGVKVAANTVGGSGGVLEKITRTPVIAKSPFNEPTYGSPVTEDAMVDLTQKPVRSIVSGDTVMTSATITYLEPKQIDPLDKIVLGDGVTTGPIVAFGGLVNPGTHKPFVNVVHLG